MTEFLVAALVWCVLLGGPWIYTIKLNVDKCESEIKLLKEHLELDKPKLAIAHEDMVYFKENSI